MKIEDITKAYNNIGTSKNMDEEILEAMREARTNGKQRKPGRILHSRKAVRALAIAASFVLVICVFQIPAVNAGAREFLKNIMFTHSWKGESVEMEVDRITISEDAPKEDMKMDNFEEAEKRLGLKFLTSSKKYDSSLKYQVEYQTGVLEGKLANIILVNENYAWMGTPGNMKIKKTYEDMTESSEVEYTPENGVGSPIGMQIYIVLDKLEIWGGDSNYDDETWKDHPENAEKYHIDSIDTEAVIAECGEGLIGPWGVSDELEKKLPLISSTFTYKGLLYYCYGYVSYDKMKEFLETLSMD